MATNWRLNAKCGGDTETFYPEKGRSKNDAIAICRQCPVREICLQYALDNDEQWGIWGGMTAKERRLLQNFRRQLSGIPTINPRSSIKKSKRSGFKLA